MTFPCPICGEESITRTSRMVGASTKEKYYSCRNEACMHQYKTYEGDPVTIALPVNADHLRTLPRKSDRKFPRARPAPDVAATAQALADAAGPAKATTQAAGEQTPRADAGGPAETARCTQPDAKQALSVDAEARLSPSKHREYMPVLIKEPGRTLHLLAGRTANAEARTRA